MASPGKSEATLLLFSGRPNPSWVLGEGQAQAIRRALATLPPAGDRAPAHIHQVRGGYSGVRVVLGGDAVEDESSVARVYGGFAFMKGSVFLDPGRGIELELLNTSPVPADLQLTVADVLTAENEKPIQGIAGSADGAECESAPSFPANVGLWDNPPNNCYSYANNERNRSKNFFGAQPGGTPPALTEAALLHAVTVLDKLQSIGKALPTACPVDPKAHYLAICLMRYANGKAFDYHCLRLDANGSWSHKYGPQNPVINVDDQPQPMLDLANARLTGNPVLVGFFLSVKGRRRIRFF
jgi:hypothetical protein